VRYCLGVDVGGHMHDTPPGVAELQAIEDTVIAALEVRDETRLDVIGRGEMTLALGWPTADPRHVCKRTPPFAADEFRQYQSLVHEYVDTLRTSGQAVVDTEVIGIETSVGTVAYLVQPLLDPATLGNNVLLRAEPDPDHPFLVAVADAAAKATATCSIDAQVTNFAWDGETLTLIDVGTPFLWSTNGDLRLEIAPFARMLPAPTRGLAVRELTKVVERWNNPRVVAIDVVSNLLREGLNDWTDPMLVALNRRLNLDDPITMQDARDHYEEDLKIFPTLVRLQRVERWWREKVRKETYQWFIWSTFDD